MLRKVPIQRLRRERRGNEGQQRTARACDACRQRKMKCDGNRPMCAQCQAQGLATCVYSETKAVKVQRQLESANLKIKAYEGLLKDISHQIDGFLAKRIASVLNDPFAKQSEHQNNASSSSPSSSIGSLDDIGTVSEDLNRSEESRATGYMGKNSEVTWMQRLESDTTRQREDSLGNPPHYLLRGDDSIASTNYRLDHDRLSDPEVINAFVLPPKALANQLFQIYFDKVHYSMPIIRQNLFMEQYNRLFSESSINPGRKWLAIFNMVLAIGSRFCRYSKQGTQGDADEKMFFARAKSLSISENVLYDHEDLQQVQAETLMGFYFLAVSQINRSWKMIGIAARSGIALGLNLRRTSSKYDSESNETRKRLWWSIFHLEHLLSVMTGRVSCLGEGSCSAPPPLPTGVLKYGLPGVSQPGHEPLAQARDIQWTIYQRHEQIGAQQAYLKSVASSPSLYFFYLVDLSLIMHAITNRVYSTEVFEDGWAQLKRRIGFYSEKMDQWLSGLHTSLAFEDIYGNTSPRSKSCYQVSLALHYYSARIVLNRPCLTRPRTESKSGIRFSHSQFHNNAALACLRASLALINILPDQTETEWVYNTTSWRSFLHFLMQATIIMLIHLSIGPVPTGVEDAVGSPGSPGIVLAATKKALHWLHCLGGSDESARRAFHICNNYLHRIAPTKGLDLGDISSNIGLSQTFSTADHPPGETSSSTPWQQNQKSSAPQHAQSTTSQGFDYNGRVDMLLQETEETQKSLDSIQNPSAVLDTDIDMPETISYPTNATLDDILFLLESNL